MKSKPSELSKNICFILVQTAIVLCAAFSTAPYAIASEKVADTKSAPHTVTNAKSKRKEVKPSFPIGNKFSRGFQRYTGINFITEVVANQVVKHVIKKKTGGKVKVRLKTYSLTDLIAGKVKSLNIDLKDATIESVPVSGINVATKYPTWFSYKRQNRTHLKRPIALAVTGSVKQKDITNALSSEKIISSLRGLKLDLPGLGETQLDIIEPDVKIKEGKMVIKGIMVTKGASKDTGVPITITGTPLLINGQRIVVSNLTVDSEYIVEPGKFAKFVSDLINPIVDFGRYDTTTHAFRLAKFNIGKQQVDGLGELILVPPKKAK